jgi:hypothetical protein
VLAGFQGAEAARSMPGIEEVRLYHPPGAWLELRGDLRDRVGHVIGVADQAEARTQVLGAAVGAMRLDVREETPRVH